MSQFFPSGGQSTGVSASASVLPVNIQDWFLLGLTGLILQSKGLFESLLQPHSSNASILWGSAFFIVQLSYPYMSTGKTIALTKLINLITWTTALSNSLKVWAMLCRATQDGRVMVESSEKCGPLEKGMANHFSIPALKTPWAVWKGKKIGYWKMNSPGQ